MVMWERNKAWLKYFAWNRNKFKEFVEIMLR